MRDIDACFCYVKNGHINSQIFKNNNTTINNDMGTGLIPDNVLQKTVAIFMDNMSSFVILLLFLLHIPKAIS